jgi:hypothetical protein
VRCARKHRLKSRALENRTWSHLVGTPLPALDNLNRIKKLKKTFSNLMGIFSFFVLFSVSQGFAQNQTNSTYKSSSEIVMILKSKITNLKTKNISSINGLIQDHVLSVPNSSDIGTDITKLPEPADANLRYDINQMIKVPLGAVFLALEVFNAQKIGGICG